MDFLTLFLFYMDFLSFYYQAKTQGFNLIYYLFILLFAYIYQQGFLDLALFFIQLAFKFSLFILPSVI